MCDEKIKVAVLVSGGGTNLQAIIDAINDEIIQHAIVQLVISNRKDAYALKRAEANGIETRVIDNKAFGDKESFEYELAKTIKENKIDLIVLAGFMIILSKSFTDCFRDRIINVHPSLIPSFCGEGYYGIKVHEKAIAYGVKVSGATVHYVNEIPDGGRIIMQKAVDVLDSDTPSVLQKRIMEEAEWKILPLAIEKIAKERIDGMRI